MPLEPPVLCSADWALLLEYVRVLVAPLAAVLVAHLGLRSWRKQKVLERRLDWHERLHALIGKVASAYTGAFVSVGKAPALEVVRRKGAALDATSEVFGLVDEAWMYATQAGFDATRSLKRDLMDATKEFIHAEGGEVSEETAVAVSRHCQRAQEALAQDIRRELKMKNLRS